MGVSPSLALPSYDPCFIHEGCHSTPVYSSTGSMGPGWYCSDGVLVGASTKYEKCHIHSDCQDGAKLEGGKWVCGDDNPGGGIFGDLDRCYIHKRCACGVTFKHQIWVCNC